jgi:hypothetical protein
MKTNELTEAALDWAVANCEGLLAFGWKNDTGILRITLSTGECIRYIPSDDWSQGGPIIEREVISVSNWAFHSMPWKASIQKADLDMPLYEEYGPTPLIAAMRCFVASKLGDEIELPKELT